MLDAIGAGSIEELFDQIPAEVRLDRALDLPDGLTETECFDHLAGLAARNARRRRRGLLPRRRDVRPLRAGDRRRDHPALRVPHPVHAVPAGGLPGRPAGDVRVSDRDLQLTARPVSNVSLYEGPSSLASAAYLAIGGPRDRGARRLRGVHPTAARRPGPRKGFGADVVEVGLDGGVTDAAELAEAVDTGTAGVSCRPRTSSARSGPGGAAAVAKEAARSPSPPSPADAWRSAAPRRVRRRHRRRRGQSMGGRLDFGGPSFGFFAAVRSTCAGCPAGSRARRPTRRAPRVRARAADSRAAHPPREGDPHICTSQALNALGGVIYLAWLGRRASSSSAS